MCLLLFCFILLYECTVSLKLEELHVPTHVPLGTRAALSCRWQLGPVDVLYSVKWYKDGNEFFRHVPRDVEPRRSFPLPGVDVEESDLHGSQVVLKPAVLGTAGRYRCEVSGEGPLFLTVSKYADMNVVVLPEHGPSLSGLRFKYSPGDRVRVNCTSGKSRPATLLTWYLNGELLPDLTPTYCSENGLVTTSLILEFVVEEKHFRSNVLKLKCLATMIPVYWRSNEQIAILDSSREYKHLDTSNRTIARAVRANSSHLWDPTPFLVYSCFVICFVAVKMYDS